MTEEILDYRLKLLEQQNMTIIACINELKDSLPERYVDTKLHNEQISNLEERIVSLEGSRNTALLGLLAGAGSLIMTLVRMVFG